MTMTKSFPYNGARNIHQARVLADEPPKRTLRRVGKRKHLEKNALRWEAPIFRLGSMPPQGGCVAQVSLYPHKSLGRQTVP